MSSTAAVTDTVVSLPTPPPPPVRRYTRQVQLPSSSLDKQFVKDQFSLLEEANREAVAAEIEHVNSLLSLSQEQRHLFIGRIPTYLVPSIQIVGSRGEYLASLSSSILNEGRLPDHINTITLDNVSMFKQQFNPEPRHAFVLTLDFSEREEFDFTRSPSHPTENSSSLSISGDKATWVNGLADQILATVEKKRNSSLRTQLHRRNIYDVLLWLIATPLALWNIAKIDEFIASYVHSSRFLSAALFVYFFVLLIYAVRLLFAWARYLFPYMELELNKSVKNRRQFILAVLGFVLLLASDPIYTIIKRLL